MASSGVISQSVARNMAGPNHDDQPRRSSMANSSLPQSTLDTFQPISASAVHVLARMAARRAVTEELLRKEFASISSSHPRLALGLRSICNHIRSCIGKRWRERSVLACTRSVGAGIRSRWRSSRPVIQTGSAKAGTEKTQLFSTTFAIFGAWCLLITF